MMPQPDPSLRLGPLPQRLVAVGFSAWKRPLLRLCLPAVELEFVDELAAAPPDQGVVVWGARGDAAAIARRPTALRVEDGFVRSVGLGADLVRPVSWVIDRRGLHFDPSRASDLEHLLLHATPDPGLLAQAARLRDAIVAARLTKYNVGAGRWRRPPVSAKVILVPGQVETDASILLGATGVRSNIELLQAVRLAEPDAYIAYKSHPDVAARLRLAGEQEGQAHRWCNEVLADVRMADLLDVVDEVHVMTSLAGFEALLRHKRVVCHGQPFYAGWGLTTDMAAVARRCRRLTLDELIHGALIAYPFYFSRDGKRLLTPQAAVDELIRWRDTAGEGLPWWRYVFRTVLRRVVGVR